MRLTPAHEKLLIGTPDTPMGIYQLHIATADQLTRLHYGAGSLKWVKRYLKQLSDGGYVKPDTIPVRRLHSGKSPYCYVIGQKAVDFLKAAGFNTEGYRANNETGKHYLFLEHILGLNDVLVSAQRLNTVTSAAKLAGFTHERELKRRPYKASWQGGQFTIIPDAFLDFHVSRQDHTYRFPVLLEHDMGTEEQDHFRRRIRAYTALLKSGAYQSLFNVRTITVAFTTCKGVNRLHQMRQWTQAELSNEPAASVFYFADLTRPPPPNIWLQPIWYSVGNQPQALLSL